MNYQIEIEARDKLFFKDARPIGGSDVGHGANWPLPTLFHSAMLSAIHENGYDENWESNHNKNNKDKNNRRFTLGGLKTFGPFPNIDDEIYFPTPADIEPSKSIMQPIELEGKSNLPTPLIYPVANSGGPTKDEIGQWISGSELEKYLNNEICTTRKSTDIFIAESAPGVAIDAETRANEDKKFYQTEYLRLKDNCSMTAFADCEARKFNGDTVDVLDKFFDNKTKNFIFGGQRALAYMTAKREKLQEFTKPKGTRIKWVLLSPILFNKGWFPDWVDSKTGKVLLKERPKKGSLSRKEWREKIKNAPSIGAKLVASKMPKPLTMSGWKLDLEKDNAGGKPKATKLAVSAGAVYYFECDNESEADKLVNELHCKIKSTNLGEQGFGLGFCGTWKLKNLNNK